MEETGFLVKFIVSHCKESIFDVDLYYDPQGPFNKEWRNTSRYLTIYYLKSPCIDLKTDAALDKLL